MYYLLSIALIVIIYLGCSEGQVSDSVGVVFQNTDNSFCITNSSYAMIWNDETWDNTKIESEYTEPVDHGATLYCSLDKGVPCTNDWIISNWVPSDSIEDNIGEVILDRRWEALDIIKTGYVTGYQYTLTFIKVMEITSNENIRIPFSIRMKSNAHIFLCDTEHPPSANCYWFILDGWGDKKNRLATVLRKCRNYGDTIPGINDEYPGEDCGKRRKEYLGPPLLNEDEWRHFVVERNGAVLKFIKVAINGTEEPILTYRDREPFDINFLIIHGKNSYGLWKFHKYEYIKATKEHPLQPLGKSFVPNNGFLCISFFVRTCIGCVLTVKTCDPDDNCVSSNTYGSRDGKWEEKKIMNSNVVGTQLQLWLLTKFEDETGFCALDSIKPCSEKGYRQLKITNRRNKSRKCQILDYDSISNQLPANLRDKDNYCALDTFSSYCLPCKIFGKEYCDEGKVWEFTDKDEYSCTSGYSDEDCVQPCSDNKYGFNCKMTCGHCTKNSCDYKSGFCSESDCKSDYTGPRCDIPLGIIWNTYPNVLDVSPTSCYLQILVTDHGSDAYFGIEEPDHYYFQFKKHGEDRWENVTNKPKELIDRSAVYLENLKSDTEYDVRVVVYKTGGIVNNGNSLKVFQFKTPCKDIEPDDLSVDTTDTTATVKFKNANIEILCPLNKYTFTIGSRQARLSNESLQFDNLKPFETYVLLFVKKGKTGKSQKDKHKQFKTQEGAPGKVKNPKTESTSTSIDIRWEPPFDKNGIIKYYLVKYKVQQHMACSNKLPESDFKTVNTTELTITLKNLDPYSKYEIQVSAVTIYEGNAIHTTKQTKEENSISSHEIPHVINIEPGEDNITLILELTKNCDEIHGPIFIWGNFSCQEEWCKKHQFSAPYGAPIKRAVILGDLIPFSNYTIHFTACRQNNLDTCGHLMQQVVKTKPSAPNKVRNLLVYSKNASSISVRWQPPYPPYGILSGYRVRLDAQYGWTKHEEGFNLNVTETRCSLWPEFHCMTIADLSAGWNYDIAVSGINIEPPQPGKVEIKKKVSTIEEAPEQPYDLSIMWLEDDIILSWKHPNVTNGNLVRFDIRLYKNGTYYGEATYPLMNYMLEYTHQEVYPNPSNEYIVEVYAVNGAGSSRVPARKSDTSPPPKPLLHENPTMVDMSNTSIIISVPELKASLWPYTFVCHFCLLINDTNTDITNDYNNDFMDEHIRNTLKDFGKYRIVYCEKNNTRYKEVKYTVGENTTRSSLGRYKNPPLKPGRRYSVVAYMLTEYKNKTRYNMYTINAFTGGDPSIALPLPPKDGGGNPGLYALLLLLIVPVVLIPLIYWKFKHKGLPLFGISLRRRSMTTSDNYTTQDSVPLTTKPIIRPVTKVAVVQPLIEKKITTKELKNPGEENSGPDAVIHSKSIMVVNFEDYVKHSIQDKELEKQHALFPRGQTMPWTYGALKANKPKNRYNNLIAYDHTRVKLTKIHGDHHSDYINANYIDGYKMSNAYIATQGPKSTTLNDFWRMIWQENVRNIIMLANIYEGGKKKVEQYWPNINEDLEFGDVTVQYVSTDIFANYEYRKFNVTCKEETRKIEQLHFTSWPDHGVPLYSQSLVPFLQKMLKIPLTRNSPVVVHCSAGVGRTGTIILCDISLRMAAREGAVDMLRILQKIRGQRSNMVDNYEQYKLAHLVVLECLVGLQTSIPCNDDMEANVTKLIESEGVRTQMKYLRDTAWQDQAMTTVATASRATPLYTEKNRDSNIVPESHSCIFIPRHPIEEESSSYINAVEVDGFRAPARFVVTQNPLPNTLGDFWRLVVEREISVIISLNEINEIDKTCCKIWPDRVLPEIQPVDFIVLKHSKTTSLDSYDVHNIHLINNIKKQNTLVQVIAMKNWLPKHPLPPSEEEFLTFWEEANAHSRGSTQVLVTCYDGAMACGIYVAMSFVIEKMKLEQECDVCQAVRNIRHNRKQFIELPEQYQFLLEASLKYINGFQSYANFS